MSLHLSDWKWTCIAGLVLTGLAVLVVFGFHPGGFETQGYWFAVLLPGAFIALPVADQVYKIVPKAEPVVAWVGTIGFSFIWYWLVIYAINKVRRFLGGA